MGLNKRKRQKNYYLLVEKTTLYDHRNLKKMGIKNVQIMLSYQQPSYTQFFLVLKLPIFFSKAKNPALKTHIIFFCFLLTQLHLGNFTCKQNEKLPKKIYQTFYHPFLLKTKHQQHKRNKTKQNKTKQKHT